MKVQLFLLVLSFFAIEGFSQEKNTNAKNFTNVYHYGNNISYVNFDGTRSTIFISGRTARVFNADGSQSMVEFNGATPRFVGVNGMTSLINYNGKTSTVENPDGSRVIVNHMRNTSGCSVGSERTSLLHIYGNKRSRRTKSKIDVLVHMNWLAQKKAALISEDITVIDLED